MNQIKVIETKTSWGFEMLVNEELKTLNTNSDVASVSVEYHMSSAYDGQNAITTYIAIITYFDLSEGK